MNLNPGAIRYRAREREARHRINEANRVVIAHIRGLLPVAPSFRAPQIRTPRAQFNVNQATQLYATIEAQAERSYWSQTRFQPYLRDEYPLEDFMQDMYLVLGASRDATKWEQPGYTSGAVRGMLRNFVAKHGTLLLARSIDAPLSMTDGSSDLTLTDTLSDHYNLEEHVLAREMFGRIHGNDLAELMP